MNDFLTSVLSTFLVIIPWAAFFVFYGWNLEKRFEDHEEKEHKAIAGIMNNNFNAMHERLKDLESKSCVLNQEIKEMKELNLIGNIQ